MITDMSRRDLVDASFYVCIILCPLTYCIPHLSCILESLREPFKQWCLSLTTKFYKWICPKCDQNFKSLNIL
jgi:hypothetical protein